MRQDWDDARPRSNQWRPPQRDSNDTTGMPLPPRRHVSPEARPTAFAGYEPPAQPPRPTEAKATPRDDDRGAGRVLRRVDGTPIPATRAKPVRRRATRQPTPPEAAAPAPLDYQSVDYALGAPTVAPAYTDYPDIILELPPTRLESQPRPAHEQSAPLRSRGPANVLPTTLPGGTSRAMTQRQSPPAPTRSGGERPLARAIPEQAIAPYGELAPLPPGVCPHCRGAGYLRLDVPIGHHSFGKAVACSCKETEIEERRRYDLWRLSNLDAFQAMTFTSFDPHVPGTREAWESARKYAENPKGWLLLSGKCGSGKTHLAAAIANMQFELGSLVLFTVVPHLLDHLRATFAPKSKTTYDVLFDKVCQAGLLVLDDLGAEKSSPWAQEKLFQIINHRYMYRYPTVITTNLELINDIDDRVR